MIQVFTTSMTFFCLAALTSAAEAMLIITLSPASDGGIKLAASGTSVGEAPGGDNATQFLFAPGIATDGFAAAPATADTFEIADVPYTVLDAVFSSDNSGGFDGPPNTLISLSTVENIPQAGVIDLSNFMARFPVSRMAFSDLLPGTYASTSVAGVTLVIVPEPSAAFMCSLITSGALTSLGRRSRRD